MKAKVTISDFVVALMDLLEAESRALQESAALFMEEQRESFRRTAYRSGWAVGWIVAAVLSLVGAVGFLVWGLYRLTAIYLSETAAPFVAAGLLLLSALVFGLLATRQGRS